jgi:type I restriction enzyme M protein
MLAIVLPDGILTNSSMQYVRTKLEDWFRIVAVVSMPQTAFAANGAGVKSSVLFLRKWTKEHTERLENQKKSIEAKLLEDAHYLAKRGQWEKEIKQKQKEKLESMKSRTLRSVTAIKQTQEFKDWNTELLSEYNAKIDELKSKLAEDYQKKKQKDLPDYPIFMAIADEIGYDATGKKTAVNELTTIGDELKKFILSLD